MGVTASASVPAHRLQRNDATGHSAHVIPSGAKEAAGHAAPAASRTTSWRTAGGLGARTRRPGEPVLQTLPEGTSRLGLVTGKGSCIVGVGRNGVERAGPQEDVQALDLVDEQFDRASRRDHFGARVALEPRSPLREHAQLLVVEPADVHRASLWRFAWIR